MNELDELYNSIQMKEEELINLYVNIKELDKTLTDLFIFTEEHGKTLLHHRQYGQLVSYIRKIMEKINE
jgi:hypothetical protein